ncbi:hypothetical protein OYE22_25270 [Streptomyces sp. 71268]|nr:hypothetical protein [Streptomyces sp. 71268]WEV28121.1 hypothetical protein OYE22_25270 [Streptomyces sp. 71268]
MTACAIETAPQTDRTTRSTHPETAPGPAPGDGGRGPGDAVRGPAEHTTAATAAQPGPAALTLAADGSYAARLAVCRATGEWFPERWTLSGPEPYAVPLPARQPEEPESEVSPLADGRVLIRRQVAERHALSLLYPAGPGTGELPLGFIECDELSLLPPAPCGTLAYALAPGEHSTHVWLVHGGSFGPEHVAEVPGRCTGGSWLDRSGRLLALDREWNGRVKSVVVDLRRGGETTPLLQIAEDSDDRLVLADPDSGLLLVRSNAPGRERLGWGVLGSTLPVRFPDCLDPRPTDPRTGGTAHPAVTLAPFAAQPGQTLTPENCAVAFRLTPAHPGGGASWVAVWRPADRRLRHLSAPSGWLPGAGLWTRDGELRLPYATTQTACGLARLRAADLAPQPPARRRTQAGPTQAQLAQAGPVGRGVRDGVGQARAGGTVRAPGAGRSRAPGHSLAPYEPARFRAPLPAYEAPPPMHERCAEQPAHPAAPRAGRTLPLDASRPWQHEGPGPHDESQHHAGPHSVGSHSVDQHYGRPHHVSPYDESRHRASAYEAPAAWGPAADPRRAAAAPRPVPLQQAPLERPA